MARGKRSQEKSKVIPMFDESDRYVDEDDSSAEEDEIVGGEARARARCPLCGMVGDVYRNSKAPNLPTLEGYPYDVKAWRVRYGGFRWDDKLKKRIGLMKYYPMDVALIPLLKIYLAQSYDLCGKLLEDLQALGVDMPDNLQEAIKALGRIEVLWADLDEVYEGIDK